MKTLNEELQELRDLKTKAEAEGAEKKEADAAFKQQQERCLQRMEIERCKAWRGDEYLYSVVEKVKGQIEDRAPYLRWCLENDPAIQEFLAEMLDCVGVAAGEGRSRWTVEDAEQAFYEAVLGTSAIAYKEKTDIMNQQARAHVDDGAPLPPGLTFRPDPYISMRRS